MSKNTVLKKISINEFKGISPTSPVIIDFGELKKNTVLFKGDQTVGKTTSLEAIQYLMGRNLDLDNDLLPNLESKKMSGEMEFSYGGVDYRAKFTKSKFTVEVKADLGGDDSEWVERKSPKSLLQEIFKTAVVPMDLRYKSGADQVKFFGDVFPLEGEIKEIIESRTQELKSDIIERREMGREVKSKKAELDQNPTYKTYVELEDKFVERIENIRSKTFNEDEYEKLLEQKANKTVEENKLETFKKIVSDEEEKLTKLEAQLKEIQEKIEVSKGNVKKGKKSIKEQQKKVDELQDIDEKVQEQKDLKETFESDKKAVEAYDEMLKKEKAYNDIEIEYQLLDSKIVNLRKALSDARADSAPKIKNVEVVFDVFGNDDENKDEDAKIQDWRDLGIYYKGKPLSVASGSEYMQAIVSIMESSGSRFMFFDDISTIGSEGIGFIENDLAKRIAKDNGVIFAAEMARGQKLTITTL